MFFSPLCSLLRAIRVCICLSSGCIIFMMRFRLRYSHFTDIRTVIDSLFGQDCSRRRLPTLYPDNNPWCCDCLLYCQFFVHYAHSQPKKTRTKMQKTNIKHYYDLQRMKAVCAAFAPLQLPHLKSSRYEDNHYYARQKNNNGIKQNQKFRIHHTIPRCPIGSHCWTEEAHTLSTTKSVNNFYFRPF